MKAPEDGGPIAASINRLEDGSLVSVGGLTIRDWFAGQVTVPPEMTVKQIEILTGEAFPPDIIGQTAAVIKARAAFRFMEADAIMDARKFIEEAKS